MRPLPSYLRKALTGIALCCVTVTAWAQETLPYWKDIQTVGVNREPARTAFMTYDNRTDALTLDKASSPYYQLLNGTWNFYYVDAYKDLPAGIEQPGANIQWTDIKVPGNWEVQGHGIAIYTNHGYEWKPRNPQPPQLPEATPVGVYQRDFEIPANWDGRDIFLSIDGAKSGVYVYVNGKEVGYSEDSKSTAEFKLNKYLKEGKNSLVLKIFRWSTGAYLECQDFWRISGIERDVFLFSQPKTHIRDFQVVSTLDDTYKNGIFKLAVAVKDAQPSTSIAYTKESLEKALRLVDYLELGELMARDALNREESCGGHFRSEHQTEEGEALRHDDKFAYAAVWEYKGMDKEPELTKEPLDYEFTHRAQRNYKD